MGATPQIDWTQWILPNWIKVESKYPQKVLECAELALVASGTATLEAAVFGTPMIIIYKMASISWWISRALVSVPFAGMVNIIARREIMPELLQENATYEKVFSTAYSILKNPEKMEKMMADLKNVQLKLKGGGASNKAATHILELN